MLLPIRQYVKPTQFPPSNQLRTTPRTTTERSRESPQIPLDKYYPPCNLMNGASPRPNPTVRAFSFVAQALSLCAVAVASDLTGCRTPTLLGAVLDPVFDPVSSFSLPFPGAPRFVRPVRTKPGTDHTTKRSIPMSKRTKVTRFNNSTHDPNVVPKSPKTHPKTHLTPFLSTTF